MNELKLERWETDEYVITLNGKPIGGTLSSRDAGKVIQWLKTAIEEIKAND